MVGLQLLGFLIVCVSAQNITLTDSEDTYTWTPTESGSLNVYAEEGYQTEVVIQTLNLDGGNGDYLSINLSNGKTIMAFTELITCFFLVPDDDATDEMWFTYNLVTPLTYFYNNNNITARYHSNNSSNQLSVQFNLKGQALTTTTTVSTTTTEALPTPENEERDTITVFLYGKKASQLDPPAVTSLIEALTEMAKLYCSVQACPLNGTISTNNINIKSIQNCPVLWENYDTCMSLTFAVPINIRDDRSDDILWSKYQLNQQHLKILWETYAEHYISPLGLSPYPVPNIESIFKHKLILFCFVLVFFIVVITIVQSLRNKYAKKRKSNDAAGMSAEFNNDNRASVASLTPHYLQQVPPLFSSDFPLYNEKKITSDGYGELNESFSDDEQDDHPTERHINGGTLTIIGDLEEMEDSGA